MSATPPAAMSATQVAHGNSAADNSNDGKSHRNPYAELFQVPGSKAFCISGAVARLPISMMSLGIVLALNHLYDNWTIAGTMSAAYILAVAAVTPFYARLFDRFGQRKVGVVALAVQIVTMLVFAFAALLRVPIGLLFILAVVMGLAQFSFGALVRTRWSYALRGPGNEKKLNTAYAMEAAIDEVVFILGPILAAFLATSVHPVSQLFVPTLACAVGGTVFFSLKSTQPPVMEVVDVPAAGLDDADVREALNSGEPGHTQSGIQSSSVSAVRTVTDASAQTPIRSSAGERSDMHGGAYGSVDGGDVVDGDLTDSSDSVVSGMSDGIDGSTVGLDPFNNVAGNNGDGNRNDSQGTTDRLGMHQLVHRGPKPKNVLLYRGVIPLLVVFIVFNMSFNAFDVSITSMMKAIGKEQFLGLQLAMFAIGSCVGGLIFGAKQMKGSNWRHMVEFLCLLTIGYLLIHLFMDNLVVLGVLSILSGLCVSPVFATGNLIVKGIVPPRQLTEGLSWVTTAGSVGGSFGSTLAGVVLDTAGYHVGVLIPCITTFCALILALISWALAKR